MVKARPALVDLNVVWPVVAGFVCMMDSYSLVSNW